MRPLLRLPGGQLDWDAATHYIEFSISIETLHDLAEWFVLDRDDLTPELTLTAHGRARLRASLRAALIELRAAVDGITPYGRGASSDAVRRTIDGVDVLVGQDTHADQSLTDIYKAIHHLDAGGVLALLRCEREA